LGGSLTSKLPNMLGTPKKSVAAGMAATLEKPL